MSSVSESFLLVEEEGRVMDALDTPFGTRKPLETDSGSRGRVVERTSGSDRLRPGTSSLNKSHASDVGLDTSEGSGRGGLELGTRIFPEEEDGREKYRDVAVASRD